MAVRKKVQRKRMRAGAAARPVRRKRKPKTGGGLLGGRPGSPAQRRPALARRRVKPTGAGPSGGGSKLRERFGTLSAAQKRKAARRIARSRGR